MVFLSEALLFAIPVLPIAVVYHPVLLILQQLSSFKRIIDDS